MVNSNSIYLETDETTSDLLRSLQLVEIKHDFFETLLNPGYCPELSGFMYSFIISENSDYSWWSLCLVTEPLRRSFFMSLGLEFTCSGYLTLVFVFFFNTASSVYFMSFLPMYGVTPIKKVSSLIAICLVFVLHALFLNLDPLLCFYVFVLDFVSFVYVFLQAVGWSILPTIKRIVHNSRLR